MWLVSRVVLVAKQASAPTTHWAPTRALGSAARAATTLVVIRIVCSNQAAFSNLGLNCQWLIWLAAQIRCYWITVTLFACAPLSTVVESELIFLSLPRVF